MACKSLLTMLEALRFYETCVDLNYMRCSLRVHTVAVVAQNIQTGSAGSEHKQHMAICEGILGCYKEILRIACIAQIHLHFETSRTLAELTVQHATFTITASLYSICSKPEVTHDPSKSRFQDISASAGGCHRVTSVKRLRGWLPHPDSVRGCC